MKTKIVILLMFLSSFGYSQSARYFAEIGSDSIVKRVIVIKSAEYAQSLFGGTWVETFMSDTTKNYAGIGYKYHPNKQNFSPPKPYASWTLDANCRWQPPTPYPNDGKFYRWDEANQEWDEIVIEE